MKQHIPFLTNWLVTEKDQAKAQLKYELNHLEHRLHKCLESHSALESCPDEVTLLCETLTYRYHDYLKLIDAEHQFNLDELFYANTLVNWSEQCYLILNLKQQVLKTVTLEEEIKLLVEIASLYYQIKKSTDSCSIPQDAYAVRVEKMLQLFNKEGLEAWLEAVVDFGNEYGVQPIELSILFREWTSDQLQLALDFFSAPQTINLINTVFFYKVHPDQLFNELIHPEKLISVRARMEIMHSYLEILQSHINRMATYRDLKPGVDYLLHGKELLQGITVDLNPEFREMIQFVIKYLKVTYTPKNEKQDTLERVHDLNRAYKFWFNPNRLIDAVMVLQQRLVGETTIEESRLLLFYQEMGVLYHQLTTTECLDLYGYFSNDDTHYLLYTLYLIMQKYPLDWLPILNDVEKKAIETVFHVLKSVIEALRIELKDRCIFTPVYAYDLEKRYLQTGQRNRDAVFRILAIYGRESVAIKDNLEKLFNDIDDSR